MIFFILKKKLRSNQELELLDKALSHFHFFEEMRQTLPNSLLRLLLQELKYETKGKRAIISKQGHYL